MHSVTLFPVFIHCHMFDYVHFIYRTQLFMQYEYIGTANGRWEFLRPFSRQTYHVDSDLSRVEHFAPFRFFTTPTSASFTASQDSVDLAGGRFKCGTARAGEGKWTPNQV